MRICITIDEDSLAFARLEKLVSVTGMKSKQDVFLAALAQYRLDIEAEEPKKKRRVVSTTKKKKHLGEGSRPKDVKEVTQFFRQRQVPEPVEPKAKIFYEHYQSKGWQLRSGTPIKNWGCCLTTFQQNNADWRPVQTDNTANLKLQDFLNWVKEERPSWYGKLRDVQSIDDIDGYYIQEYKQNIGKF